MLTLRLYNPRQAHAAVRHAWERSKVELQDGRRLVLHVDFEPQGRDDQAAYHARIAEIAESATYNGRVLPADDWKRLLVDAFRRETLHDPELAPHWRVFGRLRTARSLDGSGFVTLGEPTRAFTRELAHSFLSWLGAVEAGVEIGPGEVIAPRPAAGEAHMARVAALPCVLCELLRQTQMSRTSVHHIRYGHGAAERADDFLTAALCMDGCHQGAFGVHGDRTLLDLAKVTELDLLAATIKALA